MQAQAQANTCVNYRNANADTSASANTRNGKFFISLRLHLRLHLHFTRVNRGNAKTNANARWKIVVPCLYGLRPNQDGRRPPSAIFNLVPRVLISRLLVPITECVYLSICSGTFWNSFPRYAQQICRNVPKGFDGNLNLAISCVLNRY